MATDRSHNPAPTLPSPSSRLVLGLSALAFFLALGASAALKKNLDRLRSLPPARREALAENLARFQRLDPRDQELTRRFDRQINDIEDPADRRRLLDLLNQYHSWVEQLSDDKRDALRKAGSVEKRLELVRRFHAETRDELRKFDAIWTRAGAFAPRSLFLAAHFVRCWNAIDDNERERIEAIIETRVPDLRTLENRNRLLQLNRAGRLKQISLADSLRPLGDRLEKSTVAIHGRKHVLPAFEQLLQELKERKPRRATLERFVRNHQGIASIFGYLTELSELPEAEKAQRDWPTPIEQAESLAWFAPELFARTIRPLEADYFREHANQLPVLPRELIDFEETTPPWILQPNVFDQLPAEEARRRLTFLYHLVHSAAGNPTKPPSRSTAASKNLNAKKPNAPKSYPR